MANLKQLLERARNPEDIAKNLCGSAAKFVLILEAIAVLNVAANVIPSKVGFKDGL